MNGRVAAIALVVAIAAYVGWTAAVADDFGPPSIWTILTSAAFYLAILVLLIYLGTVVIRLAHGRR